ncbi:NFX1-type zinc finger-containing protein 1-like [Anticarsia gemmatalis]|uniref:NFX1-type zinc finger-containing protein 1-like n=1 Tax=Anticarsia gemmatalis TaxID=129554 RepID=UPI003F75FC8C
MEDDEYLSPGPSRPGNWRRNTTGIRQPLASHRTPTNNVYRTRLNAVTCGPARNSLRVGPRNSSGIHQPLISHGPRTNDLNKRPQINTVSSVPARNSFRGGFGVGQRNSAQHEAVQQPQQQRRLFVNIGEQVQPPSHESSRQNLPNRRRDGSRPNNRERFIGFTTLERIASSTQNNILIKINEHKDGFMNILNTPIDKPDIFVLLFQILFKVSQSPFGELKSKLILEVCNSNFISFLRHYLTDLPYAENKSQNNMYWKDQNEFWKNFIIFCGQVVEISPAVAVRKCRVLIESVSKSCLEGLNQRHAFALTEEHALKLEEIRGNLINYAEGNKRETKATTDGSNEDEKPPENFRELSVIPTREDLLDSKPFLRPNIVNGGYSDVEHYLDVQFRLLREDCFGPLRVGINQYLSDPNRRKYDNVRIYRNVRFVGPYVTNFNVGTCVQIDIENNKHFKRINWAHSKRFLFGSLVLFTNDRFNNLIVATILDRDNILLSTGKLAVSIIDKTYGVPNNLTDGDTYTMIESEVYFEPYLHVLKVLQAESFPQHLAMQQYIVKVTPASEKPAYLSDNQEYVITPSALNKRVQEEPEEQLDEERLYNLLLNTEVVRPIRFNVLQSETWPTSEALRFNDSQYEAYKLALTHEFAVIQGPPGTGKTYVGVQVAKTLLQNIKAQDNCLMLVICYTNHALDQFLEAISKITNRIVRIGSQSRNEAIDKFNLVRLRKLQNIGRSRVGDLFMETKTMLQKSINSFQESLFSLDILSQGVIDYRAIIDDVPQIEYLVDFYKQYPSIQDPLLHWLFENNAEYYTDFKECLNEYKDFTIDNNDNEFNNMRTDYNLMLDDKKDKKSNEILKELRNGFASFVLVDAKLHLKNFVSQYLDPKNKNFKDRLMLEMEIQNLNSRVNLFNDMLKYRSREIHLNVTATTDFSKIAPHNRWRLYFMWVKNKTNTIKREISNFQTSVLPAVTAYEEARMVMDMELLRNQEIKVLGMTTSGAARMRKLLQAVSPKIVIVEEAAEVLEQHIITSLTKDCQHLILIGDHQQLRPSASYMKLAKQYNIEVSLFERMITNGIHSRRLNVQHRMRPEIAALISPHIYPHLENHPSVENFGDVLGVEKNVFFFSHEYREQDTIESNSRANHKEADLVLAMANYLIQQGYSSDDVTILAAYSGQMFYMRKERNNYNRLSGVKITVVDNYQGEESKIILLSLVRNNEDNNIGFLGTENRICVALSRAQQGFYIFGNIDMLKAKSELWTKISRTLENNGSLGTTLKLVCQVHPDQITNIEAAEDFNNVPEGGCLRKCNYQYECGHYCLLYCHGYDREHVEQKCTMNCERVLCDLGHVCPLKCREECGPCKLLMPKTLPCGHEMKICCYREPEDPENKCLTKIEVTLPVCGHKGTKDCYMDINKVKCTEKCKQRLDKCGHACERPCHAAYPGHEEYTCTKECVKPKKGCQAGLVDDLGEHRCKKKCFEICDDCNVQVMKKRTNCKHVARVACCTNIYDTPCNKKCARSLPCGHFCKKKCSESCGDCKIMVTKVIPDCNHKIKVTCMTEVNRNLCNEKCTRTLPCGHPCTNRCSADCDPAGCKILTDSQVDSPCGHKVNLPCNLYTLFKKGELDSKEALKYCKSPCGKELACGHLCGGSCSQCRQGRLHAPCKQTCHQTNICGHECQEPCNQICPPCTMVCEVQCPHSRCGRLCGEPCVPCKEKCSRRCPHGACSRLCAEACARAACSEPCREALRCGHRCRGLCGEPCPDVCRDCRPDSFPTDFLGDEYGEDDKFILLQDCGHVLELENMDNLMMGDQENIKIRQCPFCRKPIINTNRYKDLVNNMFRNEINPIKERVYGKNEQIKGKLAEVQKKYSSIYTKLYLHQGNKSLINSIKEMGTFIKNQKKMSLIQVEMLSIHCNLIEIMVECWIAYCKTNTNTLKAEVEEIIDMILNVIKTDSKFKSQSTKISEQQQKDIGFELKRLNAIVQLAILLDAAKHVPKDANQILDAKSSVFSLTVFDEDKAMNALKKLHTFIKASGVISKLEREMIVKAVGLRAGHWYKCPNGHFYCIGECGGAMQIGRCPECGEQIGGEHHALLRGNAHAPEMDGSRFAAYSEEANNMGNFLLDL